MLRRILPTLKRPAPWLLGFVYACVLGVGGSLNPESGTPNWLSLCLLILLLTPLCAFLCGGAFYALAHRREPANRPAGKVLAQFDALKPAHKFLLRMGVMLVGWMPLFISAAPGFYCYDAYAQWLEYTNHAITQHHPPIHTLLLGGSIEGLHTLLGDYNAAVSVYLTVQMFALAAVFAFLLGRLAAWGARPVGRGLALAYFACFPTIAFFALSSTKDTLFSAAVLLFVVFLVDALKTPSRVRLWVGVGVFGTLTLLLRNNALYAFLPFALLFLLSAKGMRKQAGAVFGAMLTLMLLVTSVLYPVLGFPPATIREKFCVPMQQIARVYVQPDTLSEEQRVRVARYIAPETLVLYNPTWADLVKNGFWSDAVGEDMGGFLALWAEIGLAHPKDYVDSFLLNTVQGWFPNAVMNGYNAPPSWEGLYPYDGTSYFEFNTEYPASVAQDGRLPGVRNFYRAIAKTDIPNRLPFVGLLFSPGALLWFLLFVLVYRLQDKKNRRKDWLPLLFVFLLGCTIFLGPIMLPRYFLPLFFTFPVVVQKLDDRGQKTDNLPSAL
ncbi:MAG: DUF6020 family protein [Oscillospiraceae bacterium]|jgi:hypothetical protein|nr:DUF6020 family protein [Oscillospiraceae bacterium]